MPLTIVIIDLILYEFDVTISAAGPFFLRQEQKQADSSSRPMPLPQLRYPVRLDFSHERFRLRSLSYLTQLPVHKLKIDQSFVRDVIENEQKQTIVNTVIVMGQSLGLTVIAEGVEEPEQAELLRQRRCHEAQGYLFSKPLSTDDAEAYFRNRLDE